MALWASGDRITPVKANALEPLVVRKLLDESRASNVTLTADSTLLLPNLVASAVYQVEMMLLPRSATSGAIPGMKVDCTLPASATMAPGTFLYALPGMNYAMTLASASISGISLATSATPLRITGVLVMGGSAGTLALRWAQNTSNATASTMGAGSWLRAERID